MSKEGSRLAQQSRWPPVVVEDERRRPHDKTEVVSDDTRLRHQVAPPRPFGKAEAGGIRPVRTGNQHRKKNPCRRESGVEQSAAMQERAPGLDAGKHRIPDHDQQRCRDHRLLARHSGSTRRNRRSDPPTAATPRPDAAIQRQQDTERHQRLDALNEVGHRRSRQRVHCPQHGARKGEHGCSLTHAASRREHLQCAPDDAKKRQRGTKMDEQIRSVVSPHVLEEPFDLDCRSGRRQPEYVPGFCRRESVVDRKRQRRRRPAGQRRPHRRGHRRRRWPQRSDMRILDNRRLVIEDEHASKARRVGEGGRSQEDRDGERRPRGVTRGCRRRPRS